MLDGVAKRSYGGPMRGGVVRDAASCARNRPTPAVPSYALGPRARYLSRHGCFASAVAPTQVHRPSCHTASSTIRRPIAAAAARNAPSEDMTAGEGWLAIRGVDAYAALGEAIRDHGDAFAELRDALPVSAHDRLREQPAADRAEARGASVVLGEPHARSELARERRDRRPQVRRSAAASSSSVARSVPKLAPGRYSTAASHRSRRNG